MRFRKYFTLLKNYIIVFIISVSLTIVLQLLYSYVPRFISYALTMLDKGVVVETTIPSWIVKLLSSGSDVLQVVLYTSLFVLGLQLLRYIMLFFESLTRGMMKEGISRNLRVRLYDHVQNLSFKFHNNLDTGDLMQRATSDVESSSQFLSNGFGHLIYIFASVIFGSIALYDINPTIMWICLAALPVTATSSILYFKKIDKTYEQLEKEESEMTVVIQESLAGNKVVKAFANEKYEIEKLDKKSINYRERSIKAVSISAKFWGIMDTFAFIEYLTVIIVGVFYVRNGLMLGTDMVAALMTIGMLVWPLRGLGRMIGEFSRAVNASDRLFKIFDEPSEYLVDGTLTPEIKGQITFDNVSFKFDDSNEHLLKNISFSIKKGETVAIVGKTGSGKSTIINLLLRMYDYDSGSIKIDGVELKDIKKQFVRSRIGAVLQEPFLYSKTVFQNIAITDKDINPNAVYDAARIASIEKDINTFKNGYDTLVGEKGTTLSGGQKQRVAIARVLVENKPILIFDDALSAVDTNTDIAIRNALSSKQNKSTSIIITHRITTAKEADKIIVINNGVIEAIGKHEDLKDKEGLYKSLWGIQGKLEAEFLKLIGGEVNA